MSSDPLLLGDLEEGEIEEDDVVDVDERERGRDRRTFPKRIIPTIETKSRPNRMVDFRGRGSGRGGFNHRAFRGRANFFASRSVGRSIIHRSARRRFGHNHGTSSLSPKPPPLPSDEDFFPEEGPIREWPKVVCHQVNSAGFQRLSPLRRLPGLEPWDARRGGPHGSRSPRSPRRSPDRAAFLAPRSAKRHEVPRPKAKIRSRTTPMRRTSRRTSLAHDEMSYEDLLEQYKEIQTQLDEINRQENNDSSRQSEGDETLDKENQKGEVRGRNKNLRNEERPAKAKLDKTAKIESPDGTVVKTRKSNRARSLSLSKSQNSEPKSAQEDDDEQELRRIALASTRTRMPKKKTNENSAEEDGLSVPIMGDNYEEVAMDLDSNTESAKDESEDEDTLRLHLLKSLSSKQVPPKAENLESTTTDSKSLAVKATTVSTEKVLKTKQIVKVAAPTHDKVIINLGEDSSDSEQEENRTAMDVEKFLKEARQKVDSRQIMSHLSNAQAKEYYRLKEEIAKREQTSNKSSAISIKQSKPPDINHKRMNELRENVATYEKDLTEYKSKLIKQKQLLLFAEQKVKRLQEQLTAAQKLVIAHKTSLNKINSQVKLIQKKIDDVNIELTEATTIPDNVSSTAPKKRPLMTTQTPGTVKKMRQMASKLNGKQNVVVPKRYLTVQERAEEKARLQQMEQEISLKLQELRRAKGLDNPAKQVSASSRIESTNIPQRLALLVKSEKKSPTSSKLPRVELNARNSLTVTIQNTLPKKEAKIEKIEEIDDINPFQKTVSQEILLKCTKTAIILTQGKWDFIFFPILPKFDQLQLNSVDFMPLPPDELTEPPSIVPDPILHLRSARLMPSFKPKLASATYANKLNPNWILCRYDLLGVCNDDNCQWQHTKDYSMKPEEIITDLVSYCPALCGIPETTTGNMARSSIQKYAEKILQGTSNQVSLEEVCAQLVNEIHERLPPGEHLQIEPRSWKIEVPKMKQNTDNAKETNMSIYQISSECDHNSGEEDDRYFKRDNNSTEVLEKKVAENPNDVASWLKLAGVKKKGNFRNFSQKKLDSSLHILSCALDNNSQNEELWLQYLSLYHQHPDSSSDFPKLCKQAKSFISSYNLLWMCLSCTKDCKEKLGICKEIMEFLKNSGDGFECCSHRLLEIMLYQVRLYIQACLVDHGIKILQEFLHNESETSHLTSEDICFAWLSYIHLEIFKVLPSSAFDVNNENPGHLISKTPILIIWQLCPSSHGHAMDLLKEAISICELQNVSEVNVMPLYQNYIALLFVTSRYQEAEDICRDLIERFPSLEDSWILLATVLFHKSSYKGCLTTLQTAINTSLNSPRMYLLGAVVAKHFVSHETAHDWLAQAIRNYFSTDRGNPCQLYANALRMSVEMENNFTCSSDMSDCNEEVTQTYLFLNYCILLQMEHRQEDMFDALEIALTRLKTVELVQTIWMFYIYSSIDNCGTSLMPRNKRQWINLCHRSLSSISFNNSSSTSLNKLAISQEFSYDIINLILDNVNEDDLYSAYNCLSRWVPCNNVVYLRLLKLLRDEKDYQSIVFFVTEAMGNNVINLDASRLSIYAASQIMSPSQVFNLCNQLTSMLPHAQKLWEDAVTTLEIMGNQDGAQELLRNSLNFLQEPCISKLPSVSKGSTNFESSNSQTHPPEVTVSIHLAGDGDS